MKISPEMQEDDSVGEAGKDQSAVEQSDSVPSGGLADQQEAPKAPIQAIETTADSVVPAVPEASPTAPTPSSEILEGLVRKLLTPETVNSLTKKILRNTIADTLKLEESVVQQIRQPLSDIVDRVVEDLKDNEPVPAAVPKRSPKRRRAASSARHSDSEYNSAGESHDDDSGSEEAEPKKKAPTGVRKAQATVMSKSYFLENAQAYNSSLGPIEFELAPREYATGSCGWFYGAKKELEVGDKTVTCQITVNCTVLGSKAWKKT